MRCREELILAGLDVTDSSVAWSTARLAVLHFLTLQIAGSQLGREGVNQRI
jgi:hypothetical protein